MAAQTCLSVLTPVITKYFETCFADGWVDDIDGWMARWRERGTGCTTSCLDPLLPSSVHIERHSEGHGCLWKCLCELLPGRKNIWGASLYGVWRQQAEPNSIYYPPVSLSTHSVLWFWTFKDKDSVLFGLSLITPLFSQKLEECVFISLLPSSESPFMSVRGEFKFPRAAAVVHFVLRCRIATKLIRNQEQSSHLKR